MESLVFLMIAIVVFALFSHKALTQKRARIAVRPHLPASRRQRSRLD